MTVLPTLCIVQHAAGKVITMQSHSLFHATGKAHCKTPWTKMSGTDSVRTCPDCNALAYKLDGLSEEDAAYLVASHEPASSAPLHLSRRKDGTFTTSNHPCTVLTIPCSYIRQWTDAMRLIMRVLRSCYRLTVAWLLLPVIPFKQLLGIPMMLLLQAIKCRVVGASCEDCNGYEWKPDKAEFEKYWPMIGNQIVYYFAVYAGLFLFIVPGVICAVRGCLGLTIVQLERCGPMEAFSRSFALTKGSTTEIARYFAIPFLTYALLSCVPTAAVLLVALTMRLTGSSPILLIALGIYSLVPTFCLLSFIPMQVRLYYRLKEKAEPEAGLRAPIQLPAQTPSMLPEETPSMLPDSIIRTDL